MSFAVVKYDVLTMKKDEDCPPLLNADIIEEFDDEALAKRKVDDLRTACTETIDIDLSNNGHYKGPRYVYKIARTE